MEDHPASPASPGMRRPPLTVVIPVHNGGRAFERCLESLRGSRFQDFELIVVDDGSDDGSDRLARAHGAHVLRHGRPLGPAAARNAGAKAAGAPLVFFFDADVLVQPETIGRAMGHLEREPAASALFGSYDDHPDAPGLVSQYRNLLHHYVHQQGEFQNESRRAHTFWTGCGMIRTDVFLGLGGFDPDRYRRPAIEDIELGYRLTQAGHAILLARDVQVTHLKRWTLRSTVMTDVFNRGVPWMLLMLRSRIVETDLNVSRTQRLCVGTTGLGLLGLAISPVWPGGLGLLGLNALVIAASNRAFYGFLRRRRGVGFAIASFFLHYLYFCCCGFSVVIALALRWLLPDPPSATVPSAIPRPAWQRIRERARRLAGTQMPRDGGP